MDLAHRDEKVIIVVIDAVEDDQISLVVADTRLVASGLGVTWMPKSSLDLNPHALNPPIEGRISERGIDPIPKIFGDDPHPVFYLSG